MDQIQQIDKRNAVGCVFILAMMVAPFIALIYGFGFGLLILTIGLMLTAGLAIDARDQVLPERRKLVLGIAAAALAIAIVTGIAAISQLR